MITFDLKDLIPPSTPNDKLDRLIKRVQDDPVANWKLLTRVQRLRLVAYMAITHGMNQPAILKSLCFAKRGSISALWNDLIGYGILQSQRGRREIAQRQQKITRKGVALPRVEFLDRKDPPLSPREQEIKTTPYRRNS